MATSTLCPGATSPQFRHYDPTVPKLTKSKAQAKVQERTHRADFTEEADHNSGLLHQDTQGDHHSVTRQPPQTQAEGHNADFDPALCGLFGVDCGTNMWGLASDDGCYQFGRESLDEGVMDTTTYATISRSKPDWFLNSTSQDLCLTRNRDVIEEHHGTTHVPPSKKISDSKEYNYDLTAGNEGHGASQRSDLDVVSRRAFFIGDAESPFLVTSPAEEEAYIGITGVTNGPSATRKRSHQFLLLDTTTIDPPVVSDVIPDAKLDNFYPAKRQRLAEGQAPGPTFQPAYTPSSTSLLDFSRQDISPGANDRIITSPQTAGQEDDGDVSPSAPPSDLCDGKLDNDGHTRDTIEELSQSRRRISPLEENEDEQAVVRDAEGLPVVPQQLVGVDWTRREKHGLSNTALRPPVDTTVPAITQQQLRPSQPRQNWMPGRTRIGKALQSCSPPSSSPGTTASDGTDMDYESGFDKSCQITDLTFCTIPNGSSIVTAIVRHHDSDWSLDPVALGHKCLGEQGKILRMIELSSGSWMLLGYRYNDGEVDVCNREGLNAELMSSPHSDTASHQSSNHSDDNWNEVGEDKEETTKEHSHRTRKLWLESDELLLLSLKDKQGMEWEEVCKRFPRRTLGALKLRYWQLRKKGL